MSVNSANRAQRLEQALADYLRAWGLRNATTIDAHCQRWLQDASEVATDSEEERAQRVFQLARSDIDQWVDHLAQLTAPGPGEAVARRGLLAMKLPAVLASAPEVFLQYDALPQSLLRELSAAARPVAPTTTQPRQMNGPALDKLAAPLRLRLWRRALSRLMTAVLSVARPRES